VLYRHLSFFTTVTATPEINTLDQTLSLHAALPMNASPGGAADLLAACLFLDRLPAVSGGWAGSL
ncbi:hypothetical protein LJG35_28965, partial [Pseudomonas aeruginosa]|nr:hypothetical protein [Pseudomonas aeruginosa]